MSQKCQAHNKQGQPCGQPAIAGRKHCHYHGGKTPVGLAAPSLKHGKYSKYLPDRFIPTYEQAVSDPELLDLRNEISLFDSRLVDLIKRVDTGESGQVWKSLQEARRDLLTARGKGAAGAQDMAKALDRILALIEYGLADWALWENIADTIERRRAVTATESKRLVSMQKMITAEEAYTLIIALTDCIRRHVTDRATLTAIQADFNSLVVARGESKPAAPRRSSG